MPALHYDDGIAQFYQGDVLDVLRQLPGGSVQCCVTSPPYWSLRDYGVEPTVWGGTEGCEHEWGEPVRPGNYNWADTIQATGNLDHGHQKSANAFRSVFCTRCGAWLGALGLEPTPELFTEHLVLVFREVRRVLRDDGTLWLNLGDSYALGKTGRTDYGDDWGGARPRGGHLNNTAHGVPSRRVPVGDMKPKDLVGIPWMVAFALRADGWYLRSDIIWAKPNGMPESVTDRPTKSHEYIFLLSKGKRYFYDHEAVREPQAQGTIDRFGTDGKRTGQGPKTTGSPNGMIRDKATMAEAILPNGRNRRSVWEVATQPYPEAHFATYPEALIEPCILAGCPEGGTVLDPFIGSGTTAVVAKRLGRKAIGIDLNRAYLDLAVKRVSAVPLPMPLFTAQP